VTEIGTVDLAPLIDLSVRIGRDAALVQGPGGNTSLKEGGILWVKASGTWLSQARERPILVPVRLAPLRAAMNRGDPAAESAVGFVADELNAGRLRPSVETTVHAALPHRVMLHVHCVETIAWMIRKSPEAELRRRLQGLGWVLVPYVRPGLPLAQAIAEQAQPETNVILLGNHGLVVAGDSAAEAESLLAHVAARLKQPVRSAPTADLPALAALAAGSAYRPAELAAVHGLATDPASLRQATAGVYFPDEIVFLGAGLFALAPGEDLAAGLDRAAATGRAAPSVVLAPGLGALIRKDAPAAVEPIAGGLGQVLARLREGEPVRALAPAEIDAIANWDAEHYRKSLAKARV
jgi:rhamnose utilization protein RhaD (predicted bifunctional aldolase and dehydrogenase)